MNKLMIIVLGVISFSSAQAGIPVQCACRVGESTYSFEGWNECRFSNDEKTITVETFEKAYHHQQDGYSVSGMDCILGLMNSESGLKAGDVITISYGFKSE